VSSRSTSGRKPDVLEVTFTGFHQTQNVRRYQFQVVDLQRRRLDFSIDADLDLMRRYNLSIQEMPLLCRRLLETQLTGQESFEATAQIFGETEMRQLADHRNAAKQALEQRRRPHRPPPPKRGPAPIIPRGPNAI
jgi:hypothetical protein